MKTADNRIAELERKLAQMERELARRPVREAMPLPPRQGRFFGKTNADLPAGDVVDVTVWYWSTDDEEWKESAMVIADVAEFFLKEGETLPAESQVLVLWSENKWVLIPQGFGEGLVRFELLEDLLLTGHAKAKLMQPDIGTSVWEDNDPAVEIEVYDPYRSEGMWRGLTGYQGFAIARGESYTDPGEDEEDEEDDVERKKYDIVWMEQIAQTIQFTSIGYMGETTANRMPVAVNWYDHQGKNPGTTLDVRDPQEQFPDVHSGAKGTAVYDYHSGYYRVVSCQRVALFAGALLTADSCASSMSIDTFVVRPTGDYVGDPPTAPTAPANTCGHAGLNNDVVLLRRANNTMPQPAWEVVDVTKHSKTVMVDVQVSGLTLQKKELTIYAEVCTTTAPSWQTWHTGDDC